MWQRPPYHQAILLTKRFSVEPDGLLKFFVRSVDIAVRINQKAFLQRLADDVVAAEILVLRAKHK